jgi:Tol biopolymer transport system component
MRRLLIPLFLFVLLAALPLGVASASAPPAGFYALVPAVGSNSSHPTADPAFVAADGSGFTRLGPSFPWPPVFSPDGVHVATIDATQNIVVENLDGSQPRQLTTDGRRPTKYSDTGEPDTVVNVEPTWSPDGSRLAWQKHLVTGGWEVWTIRSDGADARAIGRGTWVRWSPSGSLVLALRHLSGGDELDVIDADLGPRWETLVGGVASDAEWSPDGTRIAFESDRAIKVLDVATGAVRTVWDANVASTKTHLRTLMSQRLGWSPDGGRLLFGVDTMIQLPEPGGVTGITQSADTYSVAASGGDALLLTGPPAENGAEYDRLAAAPIGYWPDGSRIFLTVGGGGLYEMNADGSCEQPFPLDAGDPVWAPGAYPGLGALVCADLGVRIELSPDRLLNHESTLRLTVWNDGNLRAAPHVVVALAEGVAARSASSVCSLGDGELVDCDLPSLAPQAVTHLDLSLEGWKPGTFTVNARVFRGDGDPLANNDSKALVRVLPCTLAGTAKADVLKAHDPYEKICGFGGNDRISSVNDFGDTIDCGAGNDTATVDHLDKVKNCEHVVHREPPDPFRPAPSPHPERMRWTDQAPALSMRGDRVAFWRRAAGARKSSLVVMRRDGGGTRTLLTAVRTGTLGWSPDDRFIAYGTSELYVVPVAGGKQRRLTNERAAEGDDVSVSFTAWRDARTLDFDVYTCCLDHISYDYPGSVTIDGKTTRLPDYTTECSLEHYCAYSPDLRSVAVMGQHTVDVKTPSSSHTLGKGCCAEWLPDGKRLVLLSGEEGALILSVVDADGSGSRALTDKMVSTFSVSPNGEDIAFLVKTGAKRQLWTVPVSGTAPARFVTDLASADEGIRWSPHGRWLLIWKPQKSVLTYDAVRLDGTGRHRLVRWNLHDASRTFYGPDFASLQLGGPADGFAVYTDRPVPGCGIGDAIWAIDNVASGREHRVTAPCR